MASVERPKTEHPKVAVVLFNLGGPDSLKAVRPFLFNLFRDPAIIGLPAGVRHRLAWVISTGRNRAAQANYAEMGGASPLLKETRAQASALEASLQDHLASSEVRVFTAMRYWKPLTEQTAAEVAAFAPDEVVLLPLYPQYSTTTTGSSLKAWRKAYKGGGTVREICCYPEAPGLVEAHVRRIEAAFEAAGRPEHVRLLFSAHGLPQKVVDAGDPYQSHVERTAKAVADRLGPSWDWKVCYQSRVGPMKWLQPYTAAAITEAVHEGRGVLIVPIAFVSEHVETLVELDRDYARIAEAEGCEVYIRAPALGTEPSFIEALAEMTLSALGRGGIDPAGAMCAPDWSQCACRTRAAA